MPLSRMKMFCTITIILVLSASIKPCWSQPRLKPNPPAPREDARIERESLPEEFVRPFFYGTPFVSPSSPDGELAKIVQDIALLRAINIVELTSEQTERLLPILKEWNEQNNNFRKRTMVILLKQKERLLRSHVLKDESAAASKEMSDLREWYKKVGDDAKTKVINQLGEERGTPFVSILGNRFSERPQPPAERRRRFGPPWASEREGRQGPRPGGPRPRGQRPDFERLPEDVGKKQEARRQFDQRTTPPMKRGRRGGQQKPRRGRQRQAGRPMFHFGSTELVLPRVIKLLEEKLKLMSARQENTQPIKKNERR